MSKITSENIIAVAGAGSTYTTELIEQLLRSAGRLGLSEIRLLDIDESRLTPTWQCGSRMVTRLESGVLLTPHTNLEEAVRGANIVISQIRVGKMEARIRDEKLGIRWGLIGQETTGLGGFACGLRTIPETLKIAQAIERHGAPGAKFINFANPSGLVTTALLRYAPNVPSYGMCNIPYCLLADVARFTGLAPEDIPRLRLKYAGLNHLSWAWQFCLDDGTDYTVRAIEGLANAAGEEWDCPEVAAALAQQMRDMLCWMNHYVGWYTYTDPWWSHTLRAWEAAGGTRGEQILRDEPALFAKLADPSCDAPPPELKKRGGLHYSTAACLLLDALLNAEQWQILCTRNEGVIPQLPDDQAVEIPVIAGPSGVRPAQERIDVPRAVLPLLLQVAEYERLTAEAAYTCDRTIAIEAMLRHPLMPDEMAVCERIFDEVLQRHGHLMPPAWTR